jgi:hypothetical protein
MFFMKNPRENAQIISLVSQIYPNKSKFLIKEHSNNFEKYWKSQRFGYFNETQRNYEKVCRKP